MNQQPALNEASYTLTPVFDAGNCAQDLSVAKGGKINIDPDNADVSMSTGKQPQAPRKNYKSCEFCARRKRRCDGDGFKRCSLCIEKNQPECVYREKPPSKAKTRPVSQQRRRTSGITTAKRPADVLVSRSPHGVVQPQYGAVVMPKLSLKRCRLSASPATGLLGMQENVFLDNYFGCLGLLPLANESIIRQAMVKLMMASIAPLMMEPFGLESSAMTVGAHTCSPASLPDDQNDPSKCIMWCAIGLGALVQGAPVEKVTRYVELARASLAECFDGNTVDTARAYMAMAILHAFLGEGFMNRKYLAFATNIVTHLPKETVPEELHNMLFASVKSGCLWYPPDSLSRMDLQARVAPRASQEEEEVVDMRDLCNTLLVSDFRLSRAFAEDMCAQGVVVLDDEEKMQGMNCDWVQHAVVDESSLTQSNLEAPTSGDTMKEFVKESIPALLRVSQLAVGSGATSGVGGLFYHGNMAYMKVVEGDKNQAFENIFLCAKVLLRYPGVCRFRPHLTHCILASSAVAYRPIYDQVRDIYNTLKPPGFKSAPPVEEWTGMDDICDHIFCRSVQAEIKDYNCAWDHTASPDPFLSSKWSSSTDASCGDTDGGRSPSPLTPTTNLYPDKASKSLEISVPTSTTKIDLSPGCGPNGAASSEVTVGQTGMLTPAEARIQSAEPVMAIDPLGTASTAPQSASPALSATFPFPTKTTKVRISTPDTSGGGNGMPVAQAIETSNAVGASAQSLSLYDAKNGVEKGVAIDSWSTPGGASGPVINPHFSSSTSTCMSDPTYGQNMTSSAPLTAFRDGVGVDDSGFDLGVTDDTLKEAVEILLSEGLFEEETTFQNIE